VAKRIFIALTLIFTSVSAFLFYAVYKEAKNSAIKKLNETQAIHAKQAARGIEDFFATWTRSLSTLAKMDAIIANDTIGQTYLNLFYEANQEQIKSITRLDERGKIVYNFPETSSVGNDISQQKHIRELLRDHKPVISDVFKAVEGFDSIAVHVPVFRGAVFKGSIGILINFESLAKRYLDVIKIGETGYAWVLSRDGTILYTPVTGLTGKAVTEVIKDSPPLIAMVNAMLNGREGAAVYSFDKIGTRDVGQTTKYAVYFPVQIGDTFWSISIASAEEDVLSGLIAFRNKLTLGIGALFICGIVVSTLGARAWFIVKEEEKRKRVEKQLRESEERLNLAVDSASTGLWSIDVESQQIWATDRTLDMYGFASGGLVDVEKFLTVIHAEDRERVKNLLEQTLRNKSILQDEYRITLPDGTVRWMAVRGGYSQTPGLAVSLAGASVDITERKQAEQALQMERAFSEVLLESLPGIFYLYNFPEMRLVRWNKDHETATGYSAEELFNRYALDWYAPADQKAVAEGIRKVIELGRFMIEANLLMKDGRSVPYLLTGARFQYLEQSYCMGIGIDISERKQMEESLRDSEQNLRSLSGKLLSAQEEERSRIARELHDDVTQRLAVLAIEMGKLELKPAAAPAELKTQVGAIKNSLVKISEDIHAISRKLHPSILDDLGLVRAIQSECAAFTRREGITVTFRHEAVPEQLSKNIALALYRIIQESLRNIARHSQAKSANILVSCSGNLLQLSIADSGVGFDPLLLNKVGLGLVSMTERVKLVRGTIAVDSVPGEGTVINVQVPLEVNSL